jgi:hypothetical protein
MNWPLDLKVINNVHVCRRSLTLKLFECHREEICMYVSVSAFLPHTHTISFLLHPPPPPVRQSLVMQPRLAWNSLCNPDGPQVSDPPASVFQVLRLHVRHPARLCIPYFFYLKKKFMFYFMCICFARMNVCLRSPETGIRDSCDLSCGCWERRLGPLKDQDVLLTTGPSVQPRIPY